MTDFLLFLKDNAYVWAIVILISIALAFGGIVQNIKKKQLLFYVETNYIVEIMDHTVENISIYYADEKIENLMVSKVAIVNRGNVTVDYKDVPIASPLIIEVTGSNRILSATILKETNESSLTSVTNISPSITEVKFDYLEKNDGAVIQIIHSGPFLRVSFNGKLKGGQIITPPNLVDSKFSRFKKKLIYSRYNLRYPTVFMIITLLYITIQNIHLLFPQISAGAVDSNQSFFSSLTDYLAFSVSILAILNFFNVSFNYKTRSYLPKELRKYFNGN